MWRQVIRAVPVLGALLPVLVASALGWLPQIRVFGVGAFILAMVAIWLPQTWRIFTVLMIANEVGALVLVVAAHLAWSFWLAAGLLTVLGFAGGALTKRFGALVPLVVIAGAICGLNISADAAPRQALLLALGGLWSILCGLGIPRPTKVVSKATAVIPMPAFYPLRCGLSLGLALILGHWLWPGHPGWAPAAAATALHPDLATSSRSGVTRLLATLAAVPLSALLLALEIPPFPALVFLVLLLSLAHIFELGPMSIPLVATTIVLTVLGYANPADMGAAFFQRTVETALGVALSWTLIRIPA